MKNVDENKKPCDGILLTMKKASQKKSGIHHDDDSFFRYHSSGNIDDINRELSVDNRKYVYVV